MLMDSSPISEFITIVVITLIYGFFYSMMDREDFGFKTDIDPYFFSFTTMSTVGYGDFSPLTVNAKLIVMSQQTFLLAGMVLLVKSFNINYLKKMKMI